MCSTLKFSYILLPVGGQPTVSNRGLGARMTSVARMSNSRTFLPHRGLTLLEVLVLFFLSVIRLQSAVTRYALRHFPGRFELEIVLGLESKVSSEFSLVAFAFCALFFVARPLRSRRNNS